MRNIKIVLSYDGTDFNGWQIQPGLRTVQETLELAAEQITGSRPKANASGRTDAGVHAVGQVVNFYTPATMTPDSFRKALNAKLPDDMAVRECKEAGDTFDANRDAVRKLYRYVIRDTNIRDPFLRKYYSISHQTLDVAAMQRAARSLVGTHDFHSFETNWPNRATSVRTITHLSVNRAGEYIWLDVEADGFLYNMVRTIAGTLMNVGRGYWPEEKVAEVLKAEDRREAGPTAPAAGLFLMRVSY
ncbi:tRNA pseudouridine(38-40) synthase TruA [Zavarzinella formosa]|uniref:tRNA pseudouridine(38-40) synthase TruA n=1 Tax=Zavarzinella formosa TaxID=360055 RepID=UPI00030E4604|nr:tRNA pseudouridine(38-40) synthase TruA [Zavarzinella formosa]